MPNFSATLRTSFADLDGLVLDCTGNDATPSVWLNRAPSFAGRPRFGNPFQDVAANRPSVVSVGGGLSAPAFLRSASQHYKIPLVGDFGADSQRWAFQFEVAPDAAVVANEQAILGSGNAKLSILRRGPAGLAGYRHNGALVSGAAYTAAVDLFRLRGGNLIDWFLQGIGSTRIAGGAFSDIGFAPDVPTSGYIGRDTTGNHFDGVIKTMRVWSRRLSLLEADFAYQSLSQNGTNQSVNARAAVSLAEWHDTTGTAAQAPRVLSSTEGGAQEFWLARGAVGSRVQIAAQVGGVTLPDSDLGGNLFTIGTLEAPLAEPQVFQDAGWSAIFDVKLVNEGHHALIVRRANGGAVVIHIDFEAT